jgi:uncharacterized membrane protein
MNKISTLHVATALTGALLFAAAAAPASAADPELVKCYGISKAGENSCANAAGTHSCAGQSAADYDGGEWRAVPAPACDRLAGSQTPFEGINKKKTS